MQPCVWIEKSVSKCSQISDFFFEVDACDFRIQQFVFGELVNTSLMSSCKCCAKNAAFQLALCHRIGFGVVAQRSESDYWLDRSGALPQDLERNLEAIKEMSPSTSAISTLVNLGFRSSLSLDYEHTGIVRRALEHYRKTLETRDDVLGKAHYSCRRIRTILADLLYLVGDSLTACKIAEEQVRITQVLNQSGDASETEIIEVKSNLAKVYADLGKTSDSERLYNEVVEHYTDEPDLRPSLIDGISGLSSVLLAKGDAHGALDKVEEAVEQSGKYLGPLHPSTWTAKRTLARVYESLNQRRKAIEISQDIINCQIQVHGRNHTETLLSMKRLGCLYTRDGQFGEAKSRFVAILNSVLTTENASEYAVLYARTNYAGALARTGEASQAISELKPIISEMQTIQGFSDRELLATKVKLAEAFVVQDLWDEAEPILQAVLPAMRRILGNGADPTMTCIGLLSGVLYHQESWTNAAQLGSEYFDLWQSRRTGVDTDLLDVLATTGRSYARIAKWAEALAAFQKEVRGRVELAIIDTVAGLQARLMVAMSYLKTKRPEEARIQVTRFFESFLRVQSASEPLLKDLASVAGVFFDTDLLEETEELLKLHIMMREAVLPQPHDPHRIHVGYEMLLQVRGKQGLHCDYVIFDPTRLIERCRTCDDGVLATPLSESNNIQLN